MSYKVLLVDDKPLVLRSLNETVNWAKLDCAVAGQALNGVDAAAMLDTIMPDIVISDIKMPGMDGLELTERINTRFPGTKVIIITGYQEFDYAKKAISLGVVDLVLKPINNENLEQVLGKAIGQLVEAREQQEVRNRLTRENVHYRDQYRSSLDKLRSRFLYNLLQRHDESVKINPEELENLQLDNGCFYITITRIRSANKDIRSDRMTKIIEVLNGLKGIYGIELIDTEVDGDMVVLFQFGRRISVRQAKYEIKKLFEEAERRCAAAGGGLFCCAVSRMIRDINSLKWGYRQALDGLNSCYFSARQAVLFMDKEVVSDVSGSFSMIEDLDHFYRTIDASGAEELSGEIDQLVNKIVTSSGGSEFRIKCLLSEVCITLSRHYLLRVAEKNEYQSAVNRLLDEIDSISTEEDAKKCLNSHIRLIRENIAGESEEYGSLVRDALKFIKDNYHRDISLEAASEYINTNASYLSRLLKKETGQSFVEIVTKIRIDTAKHLILQPGSRITDVCTQVGYNNYAYFYQVFKKTAGITPTEYKKNGKKI